MNILQKKNFFFVFFQKYLKKDKDVFSSFIQKYSILFKIAQWDFVLLDNKNTIKIFKFLLGYNDIFNEGTMIDWLLNSLKSEFQTIRKVRNRNLQSKLISRFRDFHLK